MPAWRGNVGFAVHTFDDTRHQIITAAARVPFGTEVLQVYSAAAEVWLTHAPS